MYDIGLQYFLLSASCVDATVPLSVSDCSALGLNHNRMILFFISGAFQEREKGERNSALVNIALRLKFVDKLAATRTRRLTSACMSRTPPTTTFYTAHSWGNDFEECGQHDDQKESFPKQERV